MEGCKIDAGVLADLGENRGGLTVYHLRRMLIDDPVASLESYFSGFWQWIHVVILSIFALPYAVFLGRCFITVKLFGEDAGDTIAWRFGKFVMSGGQNVAQDGVLVIAWLPVTAFSYGVLYNAMRLTLLIKSKALEHYENITGLPASFSFAGTWGSMFRAFKIMTCVNIAMVLYHTAHFLSLRLPD